jgi:hypothetical protein
MMPARMLIASSVNGTLFIFMRALRPLGVGKRLVVIFDMSYVEVFVPEWLMCHASLVQVLGRRHCMNGRIARLDAALVFLEKKWNWGRVFCEDYFLPMRRRLVQAMARNKVATTSTTNVAIGSH